jgi:hypothetical protein
MTVKTVKMNSGELTPSGLDSHKYEGPRYETRLSDGRVVVMKQMTAKDLLFMERTLSKVGDIERGMRIAERLSIDPGKITFPEIQSLGVKDFKKISELAGKAGGLDDEDDDEAFEDDSDFLE